MRIWDIHPGYLNHQSLLGEHRELHGIVSILVNKKKGYSYHPETKRWSGYGWALNQRHQLLRAEMMLRGFNEKTPVIVDSATGKWPSTYIDPPHIQFAILKKKYAAKPFGRIPLPNSTQQLWAHHKYSVLARDPEKYSQIGQQVSRLQKKEDFEAVCTKLVRLLRRKSLKGRLRNALEHMWGHVSEFADERKQPIHLLSNGALFANIQQLAIKHQEKYLLHSTALTELGVWV